MIIVLFLLAFIGVLDSSYLAYEHFSGFIPPCSTNLLFLDCGKVLSSTYAVLWGIPLPVLGILHYVGLLFNLILNVRKGFKYKNLLFAQVAIGFLFSLYLIGLQIFVIHAFCFYCMISAVDSITLFVIILFIRRKMNAKDPEPSSG
jgi:uncharacterized membrane protein